MQIFESSSHILLRVVSRASLSTLSIELLIEPWTSQRQSTGIHVRFYFIFGRKWSINIKKSRIWLLWSTRTEILPKLFIQLCCSMCNLVYAYVLQIWGTLNQKCQHKQPSATLFSFEYIFFSMATHSTLMADRTVNTQLCLQAKVSRPKIWRFIGMDVFKNFVLIFFTHALDATKLHPFSKWRDDLTNFWTVIQCVILFNFWTRKSVLRTFDWIYSRGSFYPALLHKRTRSLQWVLFKMFRFQFEMFINLKDWRPCKWARSLPQAKIKIRLNHFCWKSQTFLNMGSPYVYFGPHGSVLNCLNVNFNYLTENTFSIIGKY